MIKFVSRFTQQLEEAFEIGKKSSLNKTNKTLENVIICGLGGSGIGGKIASQIVENFSQIPVVVHNTYYLPKFVGENTLVIISSYSGDTEETVSSLKEALLRKSEIACISSGGKVTEIAAKNNLNIVKVPGGNPPRAMLTYSLTQLFFILNNYGLIYDDFEANLISTITLLNDEAENIKQEAKEVTKTVKDKTILIYTDDSFGGVGTRFKQQLNENSKVLAFNHVVPEMNHNELLGWNGGNDSFSAIFLRNHSDNERNQFRMEICKEIIANKTNSIVELFSKGSSTIEHTFYLILITDWISVYLAAEYGVDAIEIKVIDRLKNELSNK
ncbi:bifunctional phosphoglucose/phosphomannose isomerase [Flavobacteriales bacterium]|nr:bifunctional phosphoglucose/phosphomannose isomerase [Flavobacteriales bacterium]